MQDLGQVPNLNRRPKLDLSLAAFIPQKTTQEGRLSASVIPQQCDPLSALHIEVHIREKCMLPKRFRQSFDLKYHITGKILFPERSFHCPFFLWLFRLPDTLHPVLDGHSTAIQGPVVDAPALHSLYGKTQLF